MSRTDTADLTTKHCVPCEGGVPVLKPDEVQRLLKQAPGWQVTADGKKLRREWRTTG